MNIWKNRSEIGYFVKDVFYEANNAFSRHPKVIRSKTCKELLPMETQPHIMGVYEKNIKNFKTAEHKDMPGVYCSNKVEQLFMEDFLYDKLCNMNILFFSQFLQDRTDPDIIIGALPRSILHPGHCNGVSTCEYYEEETSAGTIVPERINTQHYILIGFGPNMFKDRKYTEAMLKHYLFWCITHIFNCYYSGLFNFCFKTCYIPFNTYHTENIFCTANSYGNSSPLNFLLEDMPEKEYREFERMLSNGRLGLCPACWKKLRQTVNEFHK
jgi:hypothetical protein